MPLKQNPIETDEKGRFKPRSGLIDLTGMKFNRLTAVSYVGQGSGGAKWFKITKGKYKGMNRFRPLCRACAYNYGRGVAECDGNTYMKPDEFSEKKWKENKDENCKR